MKLFAWRRLRGFAEQYFEWVPWIEQVEMFPQSELALPDLGTDGILDSEGSVSAMSESEAQDASILEKLRMVYPWLKGDHETCQGDSREGTAGEA